MLECNLTKLNYSLAKILYILGNIGSIQRFYVFVKETECLNYLVQMV